MSIPTSMDFVNDLKAAKQKSLSKTNGVDLKDLQEPFHPRDIQWRAQQTGITNGKPWGRVLAYVDARAIQNRLDEVCGPDGWKVKYKPVGQAMLCGLSINYGGKWITKWDGSDETDIEAFKGSLSKSLVRAASAWGIGRYLYNLPAGWATFVKKDDNAYEARIEEPKGSKKYETHYWYPPELPFWAKPGFDPKDIPETKEKEAEKPASRTSPKKEAEEMPKERQALTAALLNLYRIYMTKFPQVKMAELLEQRYGVGEARLMALEQLQDLVRYMEKAVSSPKAG